MFLCLPRCPLRSDAPAHQLGCRVTALSRIFPSPSWSLAPGLRAWLHAPQVATRDRRGNKGDMQFRNRERRSSECCECAEDETKP